MATEKRLIDVDVVKATIIDLLETEWGYEFIREDLESIFGEVPTVDAVEVVHGRWEKHLAPYTTDYWSCTCCNGNFMTDAAQYWHYCPNCGAKMDGERRTDNA